MKIKKILEYKLKGERNITTRKPLIIGNDLFVIESTPKTDDFYKKTYFG